jgi:hypothetical protein
MIVSVRSIPADFASRQLPELVILRLIALTPALEP